MTHQRSSGTHFVQNINRASTVQVDKIAAELSAKKLGYFLQFLATSRGQLDPKALLRWMATQQRPLGHLASQKIACESHFGARDVCTEFETNATEGEIAHCGQWSDVQFAGEVNGMELAFSQ